MKRSDDRMACGGVFLLKAFDFPAITSFHYRDTRQYCQPRLGFWGMETNMNSVQTFRAGNATGVLIEGAVHVLKPSSSRYNLSGPGGFRKQYVCQDGCCDRGLQRDVESVVAEAKAAGATKVVVRKGQRSYWLNNICELPVHCVSGEVGEIAEGWRINSSW